MPEEMPQKLIRVGERLLERYSLRELDIDALKKDRKQVKAFFDIYNRSFEKSVHNFIPFTDEEIWEEADQVIPMLNNRISCFLVDSKGGIAGFGVNFPSISGALRKCRGHLFPFGWFHLLRALHNCETIDLMLNGASPEWQNTGVSAVYHNLIFDKCRRAGVKWAITNPQIEDNPAVKVWENYEHEPYMRRRCYIRKIK